MAYMYGGSERFLIQNKHLPNVLEILSNNCNQTFADEEDAFDHLGWDVYYSKEGNIISISHDDRKPCDDEDYWLNLIAPYVKPGSYLAMENSDGYRWAWYFDGKTCTEYAGDTHYYGMPDHSRIFADERDPETPIPISQLKREYARLILDDDLDPSEVSFSAFLSNCMSHNNGTLTEII